MCPLEQVLRGGEQKKNPKKWRCRLHPMRGARLHGRGVLTCNNDLYNLKIKYAVNGASGQYAVCIIRSLIMCKPFENGQYTRPYYKSPFSMHNSNQFSLSKKMMKSERAEKRLRKNFFYGLPGSKSGVILGFDIAKIF